MNLLFEEPELFAPGQFSSPKWSPDGNKIVFVLAEGEHSSAPYRIATMDADGANIQQLTEGEIRAYSPVWRDV